MHAYNEDFGPFEGKAWINAAHQGALPRVAAEAAREAVAWKVTPYEMTGERFSGIPQRLKQGLGRLIGAPPEDVILGNSNSYGLHILANGIPWEEGDEILLLKDDFPSTVLPWLALEKQGVVVRQIEAREHVLQPDEVEEHISPPTRLLCTTWVHSFSGYTIDMEAMGALCRAHDVTFVLNASQALGVRPLDVSEAPVDAVTGVGWKWLCGPYATGFCWMRPELRASLDYNQAYWLAMQTAEDLGEAQEIELKTDLGARKYDVFGTANFFNFKPWIASIEYVLAQGVEQIQAHDERLVTRLIEGIDTDKYELLSPREGAARSTLVFVSHRAPERNEEIYETLKQADVYVAYRRGKLRISPHLYNTEADIDRLLSVLAGA